MAAEGQTATNTGTYADRDSSGDVSITASVGEVTKTGTNSGTWSWSLENAHLGSQQVTITATDGGGASRTAGFTLTVTFANGPIAFTSNPLTATNPEGDPEIFTMNPDGTDIRQLTQNAAADYAPAVFSFCVGTNTFMAFESERDDNAEIYKMTTSGANQTRLTNNSAFDGFPSWSPDCARIAFSSSRDAGNYYGGREIYVMNADGTNPTRLTNNPAEDKNPAFSPDGTKIAFESNRDGDYEIYVMNANGTGVTRLTNNGGPDLTPAFSPDGTKIAFESNRDGDYEIYVMNADGTNPTRFTNNQDPRSAGDPSWGKFDIGYVP